MNTRYIKVIRDLTSDIPKNIMLVLAISIGVFGIGAILGAYSVLTREMKTNYLGTNPASATIEVEQDLSKNLVDSVRAFPGITNAERRATASGRMKVADRWYPILLFVVDDFHNMKISTVHYVSGAKEPPDGSMLVERTAFSVMQAREGDRITVKTPHGQPTSLTISGTVHDPGLAPAWQEQAGYGYITLATLKQLGESKGFDLLRVQVNENRFSAQHITKKAEELAGWLTSKGIGVHEIQVPPPGKHPHQSQMSAVLSIFTLFSFMILVLGSILVATSMATLMVKQVRQIGVMKTVGGTSVQIGKMYMLMILTICVIALLISIPLSRIAAYGFYSQIAVLLNLEIVNSEIPGSVLLIQIASGILIPLSATAVPLLRGSRISVRAALDNYGVGTKPAESLRVLSRLKIFSDTYRLALRNAFRQRARLGLTLGLLAAGGAMFMTALNVKEAWDINLKRIYTQRLYDQEVRLQDRIDTRFLIEKIKSIDGVRAAEAWDYSPTSVIKGGDFEVTRTYPDKGHGSFYIHGLPVSSQLVKPTVTEGRWLDSEGTNEVVLNQLARTENMRVGEELLLSLEGKPTRWKIIGFTEDVGSPAAAYVSIKTFGKLAGTETRSKVLRIAYKDRSRAFATKMNREVEAMLENETVSINSSIPVWLLHNAVAAHMKVLVNSLLAMAILMAVVGTIGLTSTISMNILERTREIGIMRAVGATPKKIKNLIVWEGLTIGFISIALSIVGAIALSYFMGRFIGHISFRTPLSLTISPAAIAMWIAIILVGSYLATVLPARKANKVSTREALAYE